jgi:argininosuccinate lyase
MPFRTAHKTVGALVKSLVESKRTFADATPKLLQKAADAAAGMKLSVKAEDITALANPLKLVESHNVKGGPAPIEVKRVLAAREKQLLLTKSNISKMDKRLEEAENKLDSVVEQFTTKLRKSATFKNLT